MSEPEKPEQRGRERKGYVMVELSAAQRTKLESLRDKRTAETGVTETLSRTVRCLIMEAQA